MAEQSKPKLLTDAMLGRLTRYLRMCGYDVEYVLDRWADHDDQQILRTVRDEHRTLVTRDELLAAKGDGILLRSKSIEEQLQELLDHGFEIELGEPRRCSRCNGRLDRVPPAGETPSFAPDPDEMAVWRCRRCSQPYWKGSHWDDVAARLSKLDRDRRTNAGSEP